MFGIRFNHFDIINDFVGMVMISWGVISLSRISISNSYRWWMLSVVIIAIISTIVMFFAEVLHPLRLIQTPKPNMALWILTLAWLLTMVAGAVVFLRCMKEYCSVMNWERVIASWQYSIRLMVYGVGISCLLLTAFLICLFPFLEFIPNDASHRGGIVFGGDWSAPLGDISSWVFMSLMLLFAFLLIWASIHVLMSLSRMIRAAQKAIALPQLFAGLSVLHLRLRKIRRRRFRRGRAVRQSGRLASECH